MLGKLLERLMKTRVVALLGNISYLDNAQLSFREGRSTVDAVFFKNLKSMNHFHKKYFLKNHFLKNSVKQFHWSSYYFNSNTKKSEETRKLWISIFSNLLSSPNLQISIQNTKAILFFIRGNVLTFRKPIFN